MYFLLHVRKGVLTALCIHSKFHLSALKTWLPSTMVKTMNKYSDKQKKLLLICKGLWDSWDDGGWISHLCFGDFVKSFLPIQIQRMAKASGNISNINIIYKYRISYYLLKEFLVPACLFREWHLQKLQGPGNTKVLHSIKGLQAEHRLVNQWMVKTWKTENFRGNGKM